MGTMRGWGVRPAGVNGIAAGALVLRVFTGLALALAHGRGKLPPSERFIGLVEAMGFPAPIFFAWAAGLAEFGGGLLLAVGLLTRPAAFFILVTMLVASFLQQAGDPFVEREPSLLFAAIATYFLLAGAGRLSVDAWVENRASRARVQQASSIDPSSAPGH